MKSKIVLLALFFCTMVFSQNKTDSQVFAQVDGDNFLIIGDTLKLKSEVLNLIFSDLPNKPKLNVTIRKGTTIGEKPEDYYFVNLQNKAQNINATRWLERVENDLILIDTFKDENYWQILTTACIGKDDCWPQVAIIDSTKTWVCGTKLECSKEEIDCKKISGIQTD